MVKTVISSCLSYIKYLQAKIYLLPLLLPCHYIFLTMYNKDSFAPVNTLSLLLLGSLAERGTGRVRLSLGLSRMVSIEPPSPPPDYRGETHPLSQESVKAGTPLMVQGRNLYSIVMGVEKLGMG